MMLCRVVLGSTLCWDQDPGERMERELARGGYESLLGDRRKLKGTYREFVLPAGSHEGAYPEYIIIYKRKYNPARSPRPSDSLGPLPWGSPQVPRKSPRPSGATGGGA